MEWAYLIYFALLAGPMVLVACYVPYALYRVRELNAAWRDPQVGVKTALHLLATVGVLLYVTGCALVAGEQLANLVDNAPGRPRWQWTLPCRWGAAFTLSGLLVSGACVWTLFTRTNDLKWPAVRRMYLGGRVVVHGLAITTLLTTFLLLAMGAVEDVKDARVFWVVTGWLAVWSASLSIHFTLFLLYAAQPLVPGQDYLCLDCGVDLRGTPADNPKCPHCGRRVAFHQQRYLTQPPSRQTEA